MTEVTGGRPARRSSGKGEVKEQEVEAGESPEVKPVRRKKAQMAKVFIAGEEEEEAETVVVKRGRKRKVKVTEEVLEEEVMIAEDEIPEEGVEYPIRKKRVSRIKDPDAKPAAVKKVEGEEEAGMFEDIGEIPVQTKKKRRVGRPRKVVEPEEEEFDVTAEISQDEDSAALRIIQCPQCQLIFYNEFDLFLHLKKHPQEPELKGNVYHIKYNRWTEPGQVSENFLPFLCEVCEARFATVDDCRIHKMSHTDPEQGHICMMCDRKFAAATALKSHMMHFHDMKPDKTMPECQFCRKQFPMHAARELATHKMVHNGDERPYKCKVCMLGFPNVNRRKNHENLHTLTGRKYVCEVCKQGFHSFCVLLHHVGSHDTLLERNICALCSQHMKNLGLLAAHMMTTHHGELQFMKLVEKKYVARKNARHMYGRLRPRNGKSHLCKSCYKRFRWLKSRYLHEQFFKHGTYQ